MILASSGLSGPPCGTPSAVASVRASGVDACLQIATDQAQHPNVFDLACESLHQFAMVDRVEKRLQVAIDCIGAAVCCRRLDRLDSIVCTALRTEAVTVLTELRLKHRRNHLSDGLLDHTIQYCGAAQWALFPVVLGYPDAAHRIAQLSLDPAKCARQSSSIDMPSMPELRRAAQTHRGGPESTPVVHSRQFHASLRRHRTALYTGLCNRELPLTAGRTAHIRFEPSSYSSPPCPSAS